MFSYPSHLVFQFHPREFFFYCHFIAFSRFSLLLLLSSHLFVCVDEVTRRGDEVPFPRQVSVLTTTTTTTTTTTNNNMNLPTYFTCISSPYPSFLEYLCLLTLFSFIHLSSLSFFISLFYCPFSLPLNSFLHHFFFFVFSN